MLTEAKEIKPDPDILLRCPDCAFINPEGAMFCGKCGCRLSKKRRETGKEKKGPAYEKAVAGGTLQKAFDYGYKTWLKGLWLFIGLWLLILVASLVFIPISFAFGGLLGPSLTVLLIFFFVAFVWAAVSRIYLDAIRERPISVGRGIVAGISRLLPSAYVLLWNALGFGLIAGFYGLWLVPGRLLTSIDSPIYSNVAENLLLLWQVVLFGILLVPLCVWLIVVTNLAMFRAMDRRESAWIAPIWAIRQLWKRLWRFLGIGFNQLLAQVIGVIVCYVGVLASLPLSGVSLAAVYEWIRLHGDDADEF